MAGLHENLKANRAKEARDDHLSSDDHSDYHLWPWDSFMAARSNITGLFQTAHFDLTSDQARKFGAAAEDTAAGDVIMKGLTRKYEQRDYSGITGLYDQMRSKVGAIMQTVFGGARKPNEVNQDREASMHNAANRDAATKRGAWKIGDDHATSIKKKIDKGDFARADYNLMSRAEFNYELSGQLARDEEEQRRRQEALTSMQPHELQGFGKKWNDLL